MPQRLPAQSPLSQLLTSFPFANEASRKARPSVAISACLNGQKVRYNGADKQLEHLHSLKQYLNLLPICPEVGAGMSIPRPPIQLVETEGAIRVLGRDDRSLDATDALLAFSNSSFQQLSGKIVAYIFKSRSPSCGWQSTPVFNAKQQQTATRNGVQADYFYRHAPELLLCDEHTLLTDQQNLYFILACFVIEEIRQQALTDSYKHYQFIVKHFPAAEDHKLRQAIAADHLQAFLQPFSQYLLAILPKILPA